MILERPEEPGKKYALTFTLLVHVGLLAFLFFGVQWKRSQPDVVEVELWSSRPTPAVQAAPPPPPPEEKPEPKPEPKPQPKAEPKPEPPASGVSGSGRNKSSAAVLNPRTPFSSPRS